MAIAVSGASPARASAATAANVTTSTFDPPICLLVATVCGDSSVGNGVTAAITNNGAALTWTEIATRNNDDAAGRPGHASAWYAVLAASRVGMTVTATLTGGGAGAASLQVYCVTGAAAPPLGNQSEGSSTTNQIVTTSFNAAAAASLGVVVGVEWNQLGTPASAGATVSAFNTASHISGLSAYKTLGILGSASTFDLDAAGAAAASWNWIAFEIKAAANAPQTVTPSGIATAGAFGAATVTPGTATIAVGSIPSDEAFGSATIVLANVGQQVVPTGIATIDDGAYFDAYADPYGSFGIPTLTLSGGSQLGPGGITTGEAFGIPSVTLAVGQGTIAPTGIASGEAFGLALVVRGTSTAWTLTTDVVGGYYSSPNPLRPFRPENRLRYRISIGATMLRIGGIWRAVVDPSNEQIAQADRVYRGGRIITITAAEAAQLISQGFSDHVRQGE